jgi:hypothetical protein
LYLTVQKVNSIGFILSKSCKARVAVAPLAADRRVPGASIPLRLLPRDNRAGT